MTEREQLYKGTSALFWGSILLFFNLNLGTLDILPNWAGYLFYLSAIRDLESARRDLALLRPLALILAGWNGLEWLCALVQAPLMEQLYIPALLVQIVGIYFHFQLLTDCAALAAAHQPADWQLDQQLRFQRTLRVLLLTAMAVPFWPDWVQTGAGLICTTALLVAGLVNGILILLRLRDLRSLFAAPDDPATDASR